MCASWIYLWFLNTAKSIHFKTAIESIDISTRRIAHTTRTHTKTLWQPSWVRPNSLETHGLFQTSGHLNATKIWHGLKRSGILRKELKFEGCHDGLSTVWRFIYDFTEATYIPTLVRSNGSVLLSSTLVASVRSFHHRLTDNFLSSWQARFNLQT